jgi:hypothetical protein
VELATTCEILPAHGGETGDGGHARRHLGDVLVLLQLLQLLLMHSSAQRSRQSTVLAPSLPPPSHLGLRLVVVLPHVRILITVKTFRQRQAVRDACNHRQPHHCNGAATNCTRRQGPAGTRTVGCWCLIMSYTLCLNQWHCACARRRGTGMARAECAATGTT